MTPSAAPVAENPSTFAAVMVDVLRRIESGRSTYGALRVETDPRDFLAEAEAELLDGIAYLYFETLRLRALRGRLANLPAR